MKSVQFSIESDKSLGSMVSKLLADSISSSMASTLAIIKDRWQQEAQKKLNSTRPLYLMGLDFNSILFPSNGDNFSGAVELHGVMPNLLETGFSAFDMKTGFMRSSSVKYSKKGDWYLTVPIRHSTPQSFMYGKPMSAIVYGFASQLKNKESLEVTGGLGTNLVGYQHKNNIYNGLTRIIKQYQNPNTGKTTSQSQYFTFRRVGASSNNDSWVHPGWHGIHVAKSLEPVAVQTFEKTLSTILNSIGGEN